MVYYAAAATMQAYSHPFEVMQENFDAKGLKLLATEPVHGSKKEPNDIKS
jgi:hypothetical protein